jgi:elongation factor G
MKDIKVSDTHNYAIVGHAHDGKTSLGEAILHVAGATHTLGSVAAGTTVLNHLPEEKERKTTMTSCVFSYDAGGKHFSLVDTPGDSNFAADAQIVLQRLDGAVLVVSAVRRRARRHRPQLPLLPRPRHPDRSRS